MEAMVEWHRGRLIDPAVWEKLIRNKVNPALMPPPSVLQSLPALPPPGGARQAQSALEYQVSESFSCLQCIAFLTARVPLDRQDFHQPAAYIGRTQPHAYNHLPARSFEVLMEPLSDQMSQIISTGFEGIVLFIVTSAGN